MKLPKGEDDMRRKATMLAAALTAAWTTGAMAQDAFDACELLTQAEAQKALGVAVEPEPVNPKAKRPKVIPTCTWHGSKDGKPISASATFRFARSEAEARRAFDDERLAFQTKPMLMGDASAFWSAKQGVVQFLKGRTWVVVAVGGAKPADRDADAARKAAEAIAKKL
jgi:hypothetical protein